MPTGTTKKRTAAKKRSTAKTATGNKKKPTRKKATRKYSPAAGETVRKEMHEYEAGRATSGRSGAKVKSREQAIAIGLSKARKKGEKAPPKVG